MKEDYQPNWVLRGLPKSVSTDEIKEELASKDFKVLKVKLISKPDSEYPSYSVIFDKTTLIKKIIDTKRLCYCVVNWTKYKSNSDVTQCFRCMQFGHISKNCHRVEKCLKCAGPHSVKECVVETVLCANCNEEHMANEKSCNTYKKNIDLKRKKQNPAPLRSRLIPSQPVPSSSANFPLLNRSQPTRPTSSPSQIAAGAETSQTFWTQRAANNIRRNSTSSEVGNDHRSGQSVFSEIKDLIKNLNIPKIMLFINTVSQKLKSCEDTFSKVIIVVESIFQFFEK